MIQLQAPFSELNIRSLKVGNMVELSGVVFTGRDAVHKWLHEGNEPPVNLRDGIIYHCGPVVIKQGGKWKVTAAGPTTSTREEPYQAGIIEKHGLRGIIGKGGMGEKTRIACQKFGCVYFHAIGGAAQVLAECIKDVENVYEYERFGSPEAIWQFRVEKFPCVVTIDAHGNSLHKDIETASNEKLQEIFREISAAGKH